MTLGLSYCRLYCRVGSDLALVYLVWHLRLLHNIRCFFDFSLLVKAATVPNDVLQSIQKNEPDVFIALQARWNHPTHLNPLEAFTKQHCLNTWSTCAFLKEWDRGVYIILLKSQVSSPRTLTLSRLSRNNILTLSRLSRNNIASIHGTWNTCAFLKGRDRGVYMFFFKELSATTKKMVWLEKKTHIYDKMEWA